MDAGHFAGVQLKPAGGKQLARRKLLVQRTDLVHWCICRYQRTPVLRAESFCISGKWISDSFGEVRQKQGEYGGEAFLWCYA